LNSDVQLIAILIVLIAFVINATQIFVRRRGAVPLRPISAFKQMPEMVNSGIEANRALHVSMGNAGLGSQRTLFALASSEFAYYAIRYASYSDVSPIISTTQTTTLPLALNTLRRAYQSRNLLSEYRPVNVRWYPGGENGLVYAGAVMAMQGSDDISSNMLVGSLGAEMALMLDASQRQGRSVLAVSDDLTGQAVAYALADEVLIGEELFASESYLGERANDRDRLTATDFLRWLLVLTVVGITVFTIINGGN
jgi:hypothetical protein